MDLTQAIERVSNISPDEFREKYFIPQTPVILKGIADSVPAGKKWDLDYFQKTMGHYEVPLFDNRIPNKGSAYTEPNLTMKFGDFIDEIRKDEVCPYRMFLFDLFKLNPNLSNEFPCPEIAKGRLANIGFMFFGGKNTSVRIHYDIDMSCVFHTHFAGRKRVVLFSPDYSPLLYKLPFNTYSLINIDKPDYEKYPGLRYVKGYDFILESGDTLFMPAGYWHYMTYLEGSFSVSYRKMADSLYQRAEGALNLTSRLWFDKVMNKFFSEEWLLRKENIAEQKAVQMIRKIGGDPTFIGI